MEWVGKKGGETVKRSEQRTNDLNKDQGCFYVVGWNEMERYDSEALNEERKSRDGHFEWTRKHKTFEKIDEI